MQRLFELAEACQCRRHPERLRHVLDHALPIVLLAQDELDELIAHREEGQPIAALGRWRDAPRIGRRVGERERRPARLRGVDEQHVMAPGFGDVQAAVGRNGDAARPGDAARQRQRLAGRKIKPPHRAAPPERHQIAPPLRRTMLRRAVGDDQRTGIEEKRRGRAIQLLAVHLIEAPAVMRAAADLDAAVLEADRHRAAGVHREARNDGRKARDLAAGNADKRVAAGVEHSFRRRREIVDLRRGQHASGGFEQLVGFERPVHDGHGDGGFAAPKKIVDRPPQHADHFRPQ